MRDFFCGWRRKAGCVALVIACVFVAGWVRSLSTFDVWNWIGDNRRMHFAGSTDGRLLWTVFYEDRPLEHAIKKFYITGQVGPRLGLAPLENAFSVKWHWKRYGFEFGETAIMHSQTNRTFAFVPYWSIIIPLTLFSAYLLLIKPRVVKPREST